MKTKTSTAVGAAIVGLFIALLVGPLATHAQQARTYRIGVVLQGGSYAGAGRALEAEKVDLIWTLSTSTTLAVKRATANAPGSDPLQPPRTRWRSAR